MSGLLALLFAGGVLHIPALNQTWPVGECAIVDGWHDTSALGAGVCHLEGTTWISDDWGRVVLAGHTPGAFDDLDLIEPGHQILVFDARVIEWYVVTSVRMVDVSAVEYLMPTTDETLTLITCAGDRRRVVIAERM